MLAGWSCVRRLHPAGAVLRRPSLSLASFQSGDVWGVGLGVRLWHDAGPAGLALHVPYLLGRDLCLVELLVDGVAVLWTRRLGAAAVESTAHGAARRAGVGQRAFLRLNGRPENCGSAGQPSHLDASCEMRLFFTQKVFPLLN